MVLIWCLVVAAKSSAFKSRREKCLKALQKDVNTYLNDPSVEPDFQTWRPTFILETKTSEISDLLASNPKLRAIHNELCMWPLSLLHTIRPSQISEQVTVSLYGVQCLSLHMQRFGSDTTIVWRSWWKKKKEEKKSYSVSKSFYFKEENKEREREREREREFIILFANTKC